MMFRFLIRYSKKQSVSDSPMSAEFGIEAKVKNGL